MTTMKWIALGCAIAGIILLLLSLFLIKFDFNMLATKPLVTSAHTPEADFSKISVKALTGDVKVLPAEDGKCKVVCKEMEDLKFTVAVENDTLTIVQEDTRKWYAHIGIINHSPSVTVYLPQESYYQLTVDLTTGDLSVESGITYESASAEATTGDLQWNAQVTDKLTLETTTGDIAVTEVQCAELNVSVTTGDVILTDTQAANKLVVEGSTSDVMLERVDAGEISVTVTTGDVKGVILTEKVFIAKSTTGDIDVPETTEGGKCRVKTTTGDIYLEIE